MASPATPAPRLIATTPLAAPSPFDRARAATASSLAFLKRARGSRRVRRYIRLLAAVLAISALSAAVLVLPVNWALLGNYGYIGVFVITLLASGALVVPVPYLGVIIVAGTFLNPLGVALVAGLGSALGEMTGYILGKSGRAVVPQARWYAALERGMTRFGGPVIFVAAAIPNPFFDVAGILAGASKLPIWVFLPATFLGKSIRFFPLATLGGFFI
jgi:membrane protein YqaA with SNARE-associated domain